MFQLAPVPGTHSPIETWDVASVNHSLYPATLSQWGGMPSPSYIEDLRMFKRYTELVRDVSRDGGEWQESYVTV